MIEVIYRWLVSWVSRRAGFRWGELQSLAGATSQPHVVRLDGELPCMRFFIANPPGIDEWLACSIAKSHTPLLFINDRGRWVRTELVVERISSRSAWVCVHYSLTPPDYYFTFDARA